MPAGLARSRPTSVLVTGGGARGREIFLAGTVPRTNMGNDDVAGPKADTGSGFTSTNDAAEAPPPPRGREEEEVASSTADVLAKHKFGQLHHVGSQRPLGVGRPAAVSHGACRSPYRLPYSDGDGGHRLGRFTGSQTGPFGFWGSCAWQAHFSQHAYMLKLGSWGQTIGL